MRDVLCQLVDGGVHGKVFCFDDNADGFLEKNRKLGDFEAVYSQFLKANLANVVGSEIDAGRDIHGGKLGDDDVENVF